MIVRGTRNLLGLDAEDLTRLTRLLEENCYNEGFKRFIPSSLGDAALFGGMGDNRMFAFKDLGGRDLVLIPEVTAIARQEYRDSWEKTMPKPVKLFYASRCYRYDKPQRGRYREFTQFGIEVLGPGEVNVRDLLARNLDSTGLTFELRDGVKRGLGYYIEEGFEAWADGMQIAGGGRYAEGAGWAIGVERLLLALEAQKR